MFKTSIYALGLFNLVNIGESFVRPCDDKQDVYSWCDTSKDFSTRVDSLVANLTVEEKAGLFVNGASGVDRIGWPSYNWYETDITK